MLLPAANTVFTQENAALGAASGQATGLADDDRRPGTRGRHRLRPVPGAAVADPAHQPDAQPRAGPGLAPARRQRRCGWPPASSRPLGPRPGHRARLGARGEPGAGVASACSRSGETRCSTSSRAAATRPSPTTSPPRASRSGRDLAAGSAPRPRPAGSGHGAVPGGGGRAGRDRLVRGERARSTSSARWPATPASGTGHRRRRRQHGRRLQRAREPTSPRRSTPTRPSSSPPPPRAPARSARSPVVIVGSLLMALFGVGFSRRLAEYR